MERERYNRSGKPIDRELFKALVDCGLSRPELVEAFQCSERSISRIAKELSIVLPPKVRHTRPRQNINQLLRLFVYHGMTTGEIGKTLGGYASRSIKKAIEERGIRVARRNRPSPHYAIRTDLSKELADIDARSLKDIMERHGSLKEASRVLGYSPMELAIACYTHGFKPPSIRRKDRKIGYSFKRRANRKQGLKAAQGLFNGGLEKFGLGQHQADTS